MAKKLTRKIIEERLIGVEIADIAKEFFADVRYSRRLTSTAKSVRSFGFSVSNNGIVYRGRKKKPGFEILEDTRGRPYAKLSGLDERGGRHGLSGLFFPSKYRKEFMISLRSWGKSGFNLFGIRRDKIEVTPNGVRIYLEYIEIVPDRKFLPPFMKWIKEIKLPLRD